MFRKWASSRAVVRRLFLYWLPRLLLIRRPMYHLRAGRKPYSRRRPAEETGYPVRNPEMTSDFGHRAETIGSRSGQTGARRRWPEPGYENRSSSMLRDMEIRRALEAVNFVAVHLKNDDEYAEVGDRHTSLILLLLYGQLERHSIEHLPPPKPNNKPV